MPHRSRFLIAFLFIAPVTATCVAAEVDYRSQIKPLLSEKCYSCHGALSQESNLRLETRSLMIAGGDSGAAIHPGDPADSLLLQRVSTSDVHERMPPPGQGSPLQPDQISLLRRWIAEGAPAPDEDPPPAPNEHWAFQPICRPIITAGAASHPVDAVLERTRAAEGLKTQPPAPRSIQIRRLYLDLTGLPPTAAQLADERPWGRIVDELLASPHYGQRWARHWMDIWRYCDWYGLGAQLRYSQKHLWHWRDWIVDSLNADKGYDRMILEMLAGDELAPNNPSVVAATGFLARNYYLFNRTTWLDNTIEHTGKAFLGLTLNCAKCHDHKYDPLTQVDYYRFRAIFEPHQIRLDPMPGVTDFEVDGLPRVFDDHVDIETYLHLRGDPKKPDKERKITPGVPRILASFAPEIRPVDLPVAAYAPGVRDYVQRDRLDQARSKVAEAETQLARAKEKAVEIAAARLAAAQAELRCVEATIAADNANYGRRNVQQATELSKLAARRQAESQAALARYQALADAADAGKRKAAEKRLASAQTRLKAIEAGEFEYQPIRGAKKALESPADSEQDYPATYAPRSTGRRLALARWIASDDNPLTARVAVNHVWTRHFGAPLVDRVFDFGLRAKRPLHSDVLDLLASELIRSGWSLQHLHRFIVTSDAYRSSSSSAGCDPGTAARDPTNRYYWRMNSRRMESQIVRDSVLQFAGQLDARVGGPSIDPTPDARRRSLYFRHSRDQQDKFLAMFDDADVLQCYRRSESIVPQQALALSNSRLAISMAGKIGQQIERTLDDPDQSCFIDAVFSLLLARQPTLEERHECNWFFEQMRSLHSGQPSEAQSRRVRTRFVQSILNHNDFITIR